MIPFPFTWVQACCTVTDDSEFTQRAEWLTVLAALKQKKYEQVRGLLADITRSEDHTFFEQAVQLEKELKTEQ